MRGWGQRVVREKASMVGVSPSLHGAEKSGGPCIDNMRFRYVKGTSLCGSAIFCRAGVQRTLSAMIA